MVTPPTMARTRTEGVRRRREVGGNLQVSPPAQESLGRLLTSAYYTRYCVQTAASQGVAAYLDAKNCSPNPVHYWDYICTDRRLVGVG